MSHLSVQGEQSTNAEIIALTNLAALATSSAGQAIAKTGPTTFANISTGSISGSGGTNLLAYWVNSTTLGSLATTTHPSLTELSYVKGVTSAIQTQLNSKGTFTLPSLTSGSVLFSNGSTIVQDNANLFWDDTNNRLGIGTNAPSKTLTVGAPSDTISFAIKDTSIGADTFWITGGNASGGSVVKLTTVNSNELSIEVGGVERVRFASGAGNVGIGTSNPDAKLHIIGAGSTAGTFGLDIRTGGGVVTMIADDTGHIGIGASPVSSAVLRLVGGNGNQIAFDNAGEQFTQFNFFNNGSPKAEFWWDNSATLLNIGASASSSQLVFRTANAEAIRIDASQRVGIGTPTPLKPLHLLQTSANLTSYPLLLTNQDSGGSSGVGIQFNPTALTGVDNYIGILRALKTNSGSNYESRMDLWASDSAGNVTKGISVLGHTGVGIHNTSPGALLDIGTAGSILGTLRLEGNTSGYVQIQSAAAAGSWTLTLPANDGDADQVLTTNGSGVTSWTTVSGGGGATTALDNLASVAINAALVLGTSDAFALGSATKQWSDLFLAEGGVINWDNGDATLTQSGNVVTLAGADFVADNITVNTALLPDANDGAALGNATTAFSDLFLAEGAVINFDNGDATITQTSNDITIAGITTFGVGTSTTVTLGTIELGAASDTTLARVSAGVVSIEGVNIVTTGSTDTLTNKTLTSPVLNTATIGTSLLPTSDDGAALGSTSKEFSDLFLASGGVINWANGNATLTHSTGLLTSNVPLSLGTSNALTAGTIELGAASDTTISRVSAGVIAVEGITIVDLSSVQALTNKTYNGNTFTAGTGVLTIAASKTLTVSNTLTLAGTDGKGINVGAATSGKILIGDGSNMVLSANTFPNASATSGKIIKSDGTNWIASTETYAAPGTSGNLLTSDGTNWTSAAPAAASVTVTTKWSTIFETSGRFAAAFNGGGANTWSTYGVQLATSATGTSSATINPAEATNGYGYNSQFTTFINVDTAPTTGAAFWGLMQTNNVTGTAIDFTKYHYGFKLVYAASTATLSATNADNTTETATTITGVTVATEMTNYFAKLTTGVNVKYYVDRVLKATITTNLPSAGTYSFPMLIGVSNKATATNYIIRAHSYTYEEDAQ